MTRSTDLFGRVFFEDFCFCHYSRFVGKFIIRWLFVNEYLLLQLKAFLILKQSSRDDEFVGLFKFVIQMCATGFTKGAFSPHRGVVCADMVAAFNFDIIPTVNGNKGAAAP